MMDWDSGGSWAAWIMMTVFMLGVLGLIAWLLVTLVRGPSSNQPNKPSAESILAERFARGEIDHDEYIARRDALRA
jgi:putative membrane protein